MCLQRCVQLAQARNCGLAVVTSVCCVACLRGFQRQPRVADPYIPSLRCFLAFARLALLLLQARDCTPQTTPVRLAAGVKAARCPVQLWW